MSGGGDGGADGDLRDRLLGAAREAVAARGWPWIEPVDLELATVSPARTWSVRTNVYALGSNVRLRIRESDLAILEAGFLPR